MTTNVISMKTREPVEHPGSSRMSDKLEDALFGFGVFLAIVLPESIFASAYGGEGSFKILILKAVVGCSIGLIMYRRSTVRKTFPSSKQEAPRAPSSIEARLKDAA